MVTELSIIIPVFNEESNIESLIREIQETLREAVYQWSILIIDDGSQDDTPSLLKRLSNQTGSDKLKFLPLSRHFGQSAALACGIDQASGEVIVTMDGDGQNDPKDIPRLLAKLNEGYDVVCGWRQDRQDYGLRVLASKLANRFIAVIAGVPIHDYGCTLRAYRANILKHMQIMGDMHRLLPAYLALTGARLSEIPVRHRTRRHGHSKYGLLSRMAKVLLDVFLLKFYFSYLTRPMHFFGTASLGFLGIALLIELFVVVRKLFLEGVWLSPLFFLGLFLIAASLFFLFMGALADILVRQYFAITQAKPYHVQEKEKI